MLENFVAYVVHNYGPIKGKKAFQKIFYFLTEMGIPTNLKYSLYHYGPYSSILDTQSKVLENVGAIHIEKEGYGYRITEGELTGDYANTSDINSYIRKIDGIIEKIPINNPLKLELYSTTHYASNVIREIYNITDVGEVVNEVKSIKKDKFSEEEIVQAYYYLKEIKFLEN